MVSTSTRSVDYKKKTNICTVLDVRLDVEYMMVGYYVRVLSKHFSTNNTKCSGFNFIFKIIIFEFFTHILI